MHPCGLTIQQYFSPLLVSHGALYVVVMGVFIPLAEKHPKQTKLLLIKAVEVSFIALILLFGLQLSTSTRTPGRANNSTPLPRARRWMLSYLAPVLARR